LTQACAPGHPPAALSFRVVRQINHHSGAFTEGLTFTPSGRLFESSGLAGRSAIFELAPGDGRVLQRWERPDNEFAEGLTAHGEELVQVTQFDGRGYRLDLHGRELGRFTYPGEGWGLATLTSRDEILMSNGTAGLQFFNGATLLPSRRGAMVPVCLSGELVPLLNELESDGRYLYANVYARVGQPTPISQDHIVRIDPGSGEVVGTLNLGTLATQEHRAGDHELNGIAFQAPTGHFYVTGKRWTNIYEIEIQ